MDDVKQSNREQTEKQELLEKLEDLVQKMQKLEAELETLSPEERAEFDRLCAENQPESEWHAEIIRRIKERSISLEEADQWRSAYSEMIEDRRRRMEEDQ